MDAAAVSLFLIILTMWAVDWIEVLEFSVHKLMFDLISAASFSPRHLLFFLINQKPQATKIEQIKTSDYKDPSIKQFMPYLFWSLIPTHSTPMDTHTQVEEPAVVLKLSVDADLTTHTSKIQK